MSWALNIHVNGDKAVQALKDQFGELYAEPSDGVTEQFAVAEDAVAEFMSITNDNGMFSVSASGHVAQSEGERSHISLNINPVAVYEPPPEQEQEA